MISLNQTIFMARPTERIPIIMGCIDWQDYIDFLTLKLSKDDLEQIVQTCYEKTNEIRNYWLENPDQRLTQVLVNIGIVSNLEGAWYYIEETAYILEKKILKPEQILFWGSYGKSENEKLHHILIKNMDTVHIEACLSTQKNMNPLYKKAMTNVLRKRKLTHINSKNSGSGIQSK